MARPKKFDEAEVLQKALGVFWKKGYAGSSLSDLTKTMGINAPSLYDTYGDKRQLFLTALQTYMRSQHDWMRGATSEQKPVREIIRMLLTALLDDTLSDPERRGCFMVNTVTEMANQDPQVFKLAAENEAQIHVILAELIRKGQEAGEISSEKDPEVLATFLFVNFMGIRVVAATNSDKKLLDDTLDFIISTI